MSNYIEKIIIKYMEHPLASIFKKTYWGYYTKREDNGFFWGNEISEKNIFRILNNLNKISDSQWKKKIKSFEYETCIYDYKNKRLKKTFKSF